MENNSEQLSFDGTGQADNGPVVCLGMTFENDEARREYFREELRRKLPELKEIEGFPIGEDEDIIALSDPPYYTACPNPWINEVVKKSGREDDYHYKREPYTNDVSEGKNDAVYNAHSYHTKVPYKAIMRYILHYTDPGDVILDGFSGTGMTGLAARRCGHKKTVKELGYDIEAEDILENGEVFSKLGERISILSDLSPAATLISHYYNSIPDIVEFFQEAELVIEKVKRDNLWMLTVNKNESENGIINNVIWSDVFTCPSCSREIIYWDIAVDVQEKKMHGKVECNHCGSHLEKRNMERAWEVKFDENLNETKSFAKQVPVYLYYSIGSKRFERSINNEDLRILEEIENKRNGNWFPINRMPKGDESRRNDRMGITHTHHYYTKRNLEILASFMKYARESKHYSRLLFFFQASITRSTKTNRFRFGGTGGLSGTLYIPSLIVERNAIALLENKLQDYKKVLLEEESNINYRTFVSNQSTTDLSNMADNSIDYIFTDPPFGKNLMYSELNFLWESWLKLFTNNSEEAIMNTTQRKGITEYFHLMEKCFRNYYRVLKPGHWMTVEFSNSQANVWNAIQDAIQKAGFVIANVSALDKKQGSFKAVTTTIAVKQDLIISVYKPKEEDVERIRNTSDTTESSWAFVSQHLEQLPIFSGSKGAAEVISERTPRILFDRMVAYHVQNGLPVPISSGEFQAGIAERFSMRDGMAFLESQVAEYDKKRTLVKEFSQLNLFVSDENSAIEWLRQQLMKKPQTRQDVHPEFTIELQHIAKHEQLPELDDLLIQNFLRYDGDEPVPNQILTYLRRNFKDLRGLEPTDSKVIEKAMHRWYVPDPNKQADLEKLRERSLLREYDGYLTELEGHKRRLRTFRTEAIRAGFKKAYSDRDFESIVKVGERIPEKVIQEDDKLLMYYDNACIRLGL